MPSLNLTDLRQRKAEILNLCQKYHASNVRVFGSVARGDNQEESDVDLLVDMPSQISFLRLVSLHQELFDLLGRRVNAIKLRDLRHSDESRNPSLSSDYGFLLTSEF